MTPKNRITTVCPAVATIRFAVTRRICITAATKRSKVCSSPPNRIAPKASRLVSDASSDFMCRPVPIDRYGVMYACAQKNAGPAGVTVVIIRRDLLKLVDKNVPGYLQYNNHAEADSEWNTPPTFAIYVLGKVARWLQNDIGGLAAMEKINREKSQLLYDVIDNSNGFYRGHAELDCRSLMNVTFNLPSDELQSKFVAGCGHARLGESKGASQRRRNPSQHLQCDAARRR